VLFFSLITDNVSDRVLFVVLGNWHNRLSRGKGGVVGDTTRTDAARDAGNVQLNQCGCFYRTHNHRLTTWNV
jgi:hypothetical protein